MTSILFLPSLQHCPRVISRECPEQSIIIPLSFQIHIVNFKKDLGIFIRLVGQQKSKFLSRLTRTTIRALKILPRYSHYEHCAVLHGRCHALQCRSFNFLNIGPHIKSCRSQFILHTKYDFLAIPLITYHYVLRICSNQITCYSTGQFKPQISTKGLQAREYTACFLLLVNFKLGMKTLQKFSNCSQGIKTWEARRTTKDGRAATQRNLL